MTDFTTFSTDELVAAYNETFGKAIKKGSYTRGKMIEALEAQAKNLDAAPTQSSAEKTQIEIEPGTHDANPYPAPADAPEADAETPLDPEALLKEHRCPHCGGDAGNQTPAGAEGTFLGDNCNTCHECGKTYNVYTGDEVEVAEGKTTKKRRILNPQVKINAKTEACAKEGIEVVYDKPSRLWVFFDNVTGGQITSMDSRTFAQYTPAELVAHVAQAASSQK